ncbi:MAG TPA: hypothetical protein VHX88_05920 [Solirubrobacteraceae bacterium]|jgi:hypothetical protein|nr:hypothetical protein [Solirubrobacteraceae bacterium]
MFGSAGKKAARAAATREELQRLAALPLVDLAVAVLPAFAPASEPPARGPSVWWAAAWLLREQRGAARQLKDLHEPVRTAIEALLQVGLLERHDGRALHVAITAAGEAALAAGDVRERLA